MQHHCEENVAHVRRKTTPTGLPENSQVTAGPAADAGDQRSSSWWWMYCDRCPHYAPMAFAAPVILWGANAERQATSMRALHGLR